MSELPDFSAQKPYALDQLAQLQGKIVRLSQSMVLQRARIERCRQSDRAAARDIYAELSKTREALVEALAQTQLFLMETEEYALAKVSGQLRQGLAGFALMSTGYKSVYEALSRFASSLPVGQKTNAAVVGRLMNNIKLGYYPTDPDNIDLLLRGIKFPEGVTTNLLDPCCGCGKALRQLAQGNNCYAYGVELDESRAEEAQTRLHRVGFGSFFHSSISREAFHLLFLNPPYLSVINESGGRSRHEKRFLIESLPALAYGGLLIYVIPYLEDGRLELSNNRAERSMKPFVMGRKNWLFANTQGGAQASSVIYSLIETAKENGLDPYRYLLWVLQNAPQLSETDETWAEKLLPARAPKECYMPHK